jgi:hypothetical protein
MNERIFDLALEICDNPVMESWVFSNKELEQFVKLIIDEYTSVYTQWADGLIDSQHHEFVEGKAKEFFGFK